jgi:RNA polymerase sigma factor (sigma-70 family)
MFANNMVPENDEKLLVKLVLSKNRAAFEMLINHHTGLVFHIIIPLIKNQNDREDICQDVFLKVYEKLHTFQFKSKLSTWIGNIAFNTAVSFLKKRKDELISDIISLREAGEKQNIDFTVSIIDKSPLADAVLIAKENKAQLESEIEKLTGVQKTILLLYHQDELSLDEIGIITGMPVNTVKSHLFRARTQLKGSLLNRNI